MKPSAALLVYRDGIRSLAAAHGFTDVVVFGSTARGEDGESSDLDLMVQLHDSEKFFEAYGLIAEISALCRGLKVDAVVDTMIRPEIKSAALREGFLL